MLEIAQVIPSTTLLYIAALVIYTLVVRRINVFSYVFIGVLLVEVLHLGTSFYLKSVPTDSDLYSYFYYSWYLGFAATDFLFIGLTLLWCRKNNLKLEPISKSVLWLYAIMGFIQLIRLIEREITDSFIMSFIYQAGTELINIVVGVLLIGFVIKEIYANVMSSYRSL